MQFQRAETPALLDGHDAAKAFFASCFAGVGEARERLFVAHVDDHARCLGLTELEGDEQEVAFPMRAVLTEALQLGSAGLVLAHNHPGGDPTPSRADCRITRRLVAAGEAMDLTVLDHLVFGRGGECRSMRRLGLI